MPMIDYIVVKGDCLSSIAHKFNLPSWKTIYNHPDNAEFKKKRPNPNLIYPGDALKIPQEPKGVDVATGQKHRFKTKVDSVKLVLRLKDDEDNALSNKKFKLVVGEFVKEGQTNGDGEVSENIPPEETGGTISLWLDGDDKPELIMPLEIGALDPIETLSGVKARLANLGYNPGPVDEDDTNEQYKESVRQFKVKNAIDPPDESMDDSTRNAIKDKYGC